MSAPRSSSTDPRDAARAARFGRLLLPLALLATPGAAPASAAPDRDGEAAQVRTRLAARLQAAESGRFYLVLDVEARTLRLMHGGALLDEFELTGVRQGRPTVLFVRAAAPPAGWAEKFWSAGALRPERRHPRTEIRVPEPGAEESDEELTIPPTPEELFPCPPRFFLRYAGGLTLELRPDGVSRSARERLADALAAVRSVGSPSVRLLLTLRREELARLYRAVPPEVDFLLLDRRDGPAG